MKHLTRDAAVALCLLAGFIMGFCFLWLRFTVWKPAEPLAKEPFYSAIPGVNMERLTPAMANAVLKKLNVQRCHCGCLRSVASCRNHHDSCTESVVTAQDEISAAKRR